ncbi:MAG: hypothetical protein WC655_04120 [Candidatus Hydrogenedentales bacterium]|jgi:hypothetical protein
MRTIVIHHSADYDGIFCREIARKFLPDAELIGWDFGDPAPNIPFQPGDPPTIYILDLPCDRLFGFDFSTCPPAGEAPEMFKNVVWIDHHKSAIESHPPGIPGYRLDGVSACRLAWQWLSRESRRGLYNEILPTKQDFIDRQVAEPLAVRLAGEYDVWDHRDDGDVEFQFGLDSVALTPAGWATLLNEHSGEYAKELIEFGKVAMACYGKRDADIMRTRSFLVDFEGLKFLALNTARCNSNTFSARDVPETGHDALMGFYFNGKVWGVSLYHAGHRKDLDLSQIAVKHGGGGHRGACGFTCNKPPFLP